MEENTHEKHDEDHHKESHEEHHGDQNKEHHKETHETHHEEHHEEKPKEPILKRIKRFYINNYKKLLIIPNIILVLAILQIIIHVSMTGDFLNKGVSLKGGISITVPLDQGIDTDALKQQLALTYPNNDVSIREISSRGRVVGFSLDIDVDPSNDGTTNAIIDEIRSFTNLELNKGEYSLETIGSSLGSSFFRETFRSILLAFIFMAVVVMLYFRKLVPALIVILAVVSDIIATLAVVNLLGIKLSTGGIAAFLMLIGYSVDTDMLLSTRMLKKQGLSMHDRIMGALKTGLLMTITTIIAVTTALVFTQSAVIKQIMTILLIGLIFDLIFTWFQNMGVLRLYLEKKEGRTENEL